MDLTALVAGVGLTRPELVAKGEVGYHLTTSLSGYGFAQANMLWGQPLGYAAGVGLRGTF